jgi:hypothetical protein
MKQISLKLDTAIIVKTTNIVEGIRVSSAASLENFAG